MVYPGRRSSPPPPPAAAPCSADLPPAAAGSARGAGRTPDRWERNFPGRRRGRTGDEGEEDGPDEGRGPPSEAFSPGPRDSSSLMRAHETRKLRNQDRTEVFLRVHVCEALTLLSSC